jgi:hypothetical protein
MLGRVPEFKSAFRRVHSAARGGAIDEKTRTLIRRLSVASLGATWDPSAGPPDDTADLPTCGRFVLVREIGRGGMGRVFEAVDPQLGRAVAVKVRLRRGSADGGRFLAEARITAQLEHPGVVPVHELGVDDQGAPFYAMRRIGGRSLRDVLDAIDRGEPDASRTFGPFRLLGVFVQVCRTIAFAHDRGVLHADLKPQNVMVGDFGEVLVLDWGLARPLDATEAPPGAVGTPGYMSPEQAAGEPLDARSDVWSLGAMLYEIVTGARPYAGDTPADQVRATLSGPPQDPRERAPDRRIAPELAQIAIRALSPDRQDRFGTAAALADAVEAYLEGSRRREEAERALAEGRALLEELESERITVAELQARIEELAAAVPTWAPLAEKLPLAELREQLASMETRHAETLARVVACGERALERDPEHRGARRLLADTHGAALLEAEARRDTRDVAFHGARLAAHDDGAWARRLAAPAGIALRTDPPCSVSLRTYARRGLVWELGPEEARWSTPAEVRVAPGSHLLVLEAPGLPPVRYPVHVRRGERWEAALRLPREGEIPPGMRFVPPGPAIVGEGRLGPHRLRTVEVGGFAMAVHPVTVDEYVDFLEATGEEARYPRHVDTFLFGPGFRPPAADLHGDVWDPRWPISGISYDDAEAYAAWRSERDGFAYALPSEAEWEKAARGADGRVFPWGDVFDPALCLCSGSRRGRALPGAVGSFPTDVSPYGVHDLAGTIREWCADREDGKRVIKGGAWNTSDGPCRAASRRATEPFAALPYLGFRLCYRVSIQ